MSESRTVEPAQTPIGSVVAAGDADKPDDLESAAPGGGARRWLLEPLLAFVIGAVAMGYVQSGASNASGNDSYYHMRMAALLPSWGFVREFPWLKWTFFSDNFVSHHHGFHVALAPFVLLSERLTGDAVLGGKVFCAVCMGATATAFWAVLRSLNVQYKLVWVILLGAAPWHMWLRLSYVRAPALAMPLLLLGVLFVIRRRLLWLGVLSFALTHIYMGAVLLPLVPLSFLAAELLAGRITPRSFLPSLVALVGTAAGFVVHPYFPQNLRFMYTQLFETGLGAPGEVGTEWKSFDSWFFLSEQMLVIGPLWVACLMRRMIRGGQMSASSIGLLILNVGFLALTFKARRFVEYWPAFALLNAADLASFPKWADAWAAAPRKTFVDWVFRQPFELSIAALVIAGVTSYVTSKSIKADTNLPQLKSALEYTAAHSPAGSMIFTDDWDIFPYCFYYNHHNTYAVGLDPVFTMRKYPAMWERYRFITRGQAPNYVSDKAIAAEEKQRARDAAGKNDKLDARNSTDARTSAQLATSNPSAKKSETRRVLLDDIATRFDADFVLVQADHSPLYRQLVGRPELFRLIFPPRPTTGPATNPRLESQPAIAVFEVIETPTAEPSTSP